MEHDKEKGYVTRLELGNEDSARILLGAGLSKLRFVRSEVAYLIQFRDTIDEKIRKDFDTGVSWFSAGVQKVRARD